VGIVPYALYMGKKIAGLAFARPALI
jgi:hypothetical protein